MGSKPLSHLTTLGMFHTHCLFSFQANLRGHKVKGPLGEATEPIIKRHFNEKSLLCVYIKPLRFFFFLSCPKGKSQIKTSKTGVVLEFGATQLFVTQVVSYTEKKLVDGNSLEVHWLGLSTSTAWGMGSIPGRETKILHVIWLGQKKSLTTTRCQAHSPIKEVTEISRVCYCSIIKTSLTHIMFC